MRGKKKSAPEEALIKELTVKMLIRPFQSLVLVELAQD